ncbi:Slp family lipoprotein [Pleionea sediminis]|uniref:Slp family lipoprotein n=1 Tax=Pleionea sediminis TaxID=2569479 RepID=UPI0011853332|nr:Slp family lipoprotein [Pleionea sediminis]
MKHLFGFILLMGFLSGCSMVPHEIKGDYTPVTLEQARKDHQSSKVRWGGVIAKVRNQEQESVIEIVAKPLSSSARPLNVDASGGRFLAVIPNFVEPVVYKQGREITVVGTLSDMVEGKIGEMKYDFPVVRVISHHLWKKRQEVKQVHYWGASFWPVFPHRYYYHPHWHYYKGKKVPKSDTKPAVKPKK